MKTLQQLAKDCLSVQNACNPIAIANGYGKALSDLRQALASAGLPNDHSAIKNHPINVWWLCKLCDLSGYSNESASSESFSKLAEIADFGV